MRLALTSAPIDSGQSPRFLNGVPNEVERERDTHLIDHYHRAIQHMTMDATDTHGGEHMGHWLLRIESRAGIAIPFSLMVSTETVLICAIGTVRAIGAIPTVLIGSTPARRRRRRVSVRSIRSRTRAIATET